MARGAEAGAVSMDGFTKTVLAVLLALTFLPVAAAMPADGDPLEVRLRVLGRPIPAAPLAPASLPASAPQEAGAPPAPAAPSLGSVDASVGTPADDEVSLLAAHVDLGGDLLPGIALSAQAGVSTRVLLDTRPHWTPVAPPERVERWLPLSGGSGGFAPPGSPVDARADAPPAAAPAAPAPPGTSRSVVETVRTVPAGPFDEGNGLALAAALAAAALLALGALGLRVTRKDVSRDPVLRALREAVGRRRQGATAAELAAEVRAKVPEAADLDRRGAEALLAQLTRLRVLRRHRVDGRVVYLAREAPEPGLPEAPAARILALLRERPDLSMGEAAGLLGMTRMRLDRHLKPLLRDGLVERRRPSPAGPFLLRAAAGQAPSLRH